MQWRFYITTAISIFKLHLVHAVNPSLVDSSRFYRSFHGHDVADLEQIHESVRSQASSVIFLTGDSSMNNKHWIHGDDRQKPAVGPYKELLTPPAMVADITYHLNVLGERHRIVTINAAVEESTLLSKLEQLNQHDQFVRDNIKSEDVLVVSIGGNDVAFKSTIATKCHILTLVHFNSAKDLKYEPEHCWGMKHFVRMFKDDMQTYIEKLTSKTRPKKILACMIYFPAEEPQGGWADRFFSYLNYDTKPKRLQNAIEALFKIAVSKIKIEGSDVIPVPLFQVLNGGTTSDYVERVESSTSGGLKIAEFLFQLACPLELCDATEKVPDELDRNDIQLACPELTVPSEC